MARLLLLLLLLTVGCSQNADRSLKGIIVDPQRQSEASFRDLFSEIRLVFLETTDSSLIKRINKVIHYKTKFYVFDRPQNAVFIFLEDGEFLKKIQQRGKGPDEYITLRDMEINTYTESIELLSPRGKVLSFSLEGEFKDAFTLPASVRAVHYFANLNDDVIVFYSIFEKQKLIFYSRSKEKILSRQRSVPDFVSRKAPLHAVNSPFFFFDGNTYYYETYSNNVYRLSDSLTLEYRWDFGDFNLDIEKLPPDQTRDFYRDQLIGSKKHAWGFSFSAMNKNYLLTAFSFRSKHLTLIYDKRSKDHTLVELFNEGIRLPVVNSRMSSDGSYLYSTVDPANSESFIDTTMLRKSERERLVLTEASDNPIIVKYVFK